MQIGYLSESLEDYLETIFRLLQKQKVARVRDIANAQDVKTSSVVSALQRLAREGLVEYRAREYVDLTAKGRQLAFRLYQRHNFLKRFLTDFLQVDPETAEKDACSIEHAISVLTLDRMTSMSEFLSYSADVDEGLITAFRDRWLDHLSKNGSAARGAVRDSESESIPLSQLKPGQGGYIARLATGDERRSELIRQGILPGVSIQLLEKLGRDRFMVRVAGERLELSLRDAEALQVHRHTEHATPEISSESTVRTLADITPGRTFKVAKVHATGEIRARLNDMGIIRGAEGRILREALLRDPIEVEMGGALLSLRRLEASTIVVEELDA